MPLALHQLIAVNKSKRAVAEKTKTDIYQKIQKPDLFAGARKTYRPFAEPAEGVTVIQLPPQETIVRERVRPQLDQFREAMSTLIDTVASMDRANCSAKADIVIDGKVLAKDVPAVTLLFLEKQVIDLNTFLSKLPVVSTDATWEVDPDLDLLVTPPQVTISTQKVRRVITLAPPTEKHPAQVQVFEDQVPCGEWSGVVHSGAITLAERTALMARGRQLLEAITIAREQANTVEAPKVDIGDALYAFVYGR